jgi:hypothetical protein
MMTAVLVMRRRVLLPAICAAISQSSATGGAAHIRTGEEDHVALVAAEGDVVGDKVAGGAEDARVAELFKVEHRDVSLDELGAYAGLGEGGGGLGEREEAVDLGDEVDDLEPGAVVAVKGGVELRVHERRHRASGRDSPGLGRTASRPSSLREPP